MRIVNAQLRNEESVYKTKIKTLRKDLSDLNGKKWNLACSVR